jgi:acetate kinase
MLSEGQVSEKQMSEARPSRLLTINTGSSSLKAALYEPRPAPKLLLSAKIERIGLDNGHACLNKAAGDVLLDEQRAFSDHRDGLLFLVDALKDMSWLEGLEAVGHRVVHGGRTHSEPEVVTRGLVEELRLLIPIDPVHLPQAIDAIDAIAGAYPLVPQVACFDTAFHRHMPRVAQIYPLPSRFEAAGLLRYGFHGLSYESIMEKLSAVDAGSAAKRVIVAHLGNGASMAAIKDGKSVDTTMGFTPTGGLIMGTRSGDLDPGVVLQLLGMEAGNVDTLRNLLNKESGLIGVSELSADMQDLLAEETTNARAKDATDLFCYQARKFLGALVTALRGLDILVFTAGIGERAPAIRERICDGLKYMGIQLDEQRNWSSHSIISSDASPVTVRVLPTDEDLVIAKHTLRLTAEVGGNHVPI